MTTPSETTIIATINDIAWDLVNECPHVAYDAAETLKANGVEPTSQHEAWLIAAVVSESLARIEAMRVTR
jgi:hypothetical protein